MRLSVSATATVLVGVETFASAQTTDHLTLGVLLLQLAWTDLVEVTCAGWRCAPVLTALRVVWRSWSNGDWQVVSIDQADVVVILVAPTIQRELGKSSWSGASSLDTVPSTLEPRTAVST